MKIGIFDSGIGGITVLNQVLSKIPYTELTYLSDGKYMPYGNKSVSFIKNRLNWVLQYFAQLDIDILFIACHSLASVYLDAKDTIEQKYHIIDTISPTCNYLASHKSNKIGIMATEHTITNGIYNRLLPGGLVCFPCKNLATIIEQNFHLKVLVPESFLATILPFVKLQNLKQLVLACTHYPHAMDEIKQWVHQQNPNCEIIDPSEIIVNSVDTPNSTPNSKHHLHFRTTGNVANFTKALNKLYSNKWPDAVIDVKHCNFTVKPLAAN